MDFLEETLLHTETVCSLPVCQAVIGLVCDLSFLKAPQLTRSVYLSPAKRASFVYVSAHATCFVYIRWKLCLH